MPPPNRSRLARPPQTRLEDLDELLGLTSAEGGFLAEAMGLTEAAEPPVGMPTMPMVRPPVADPLMPQANPTAPVLRRDYPRPVRPTYEPPEEPSGWRKAGGIALGALAGLAGPGYAQRVSRNLTELPHQRAQEDYQRKVAEYEGEMGIYDKAFDQETRMQQHRERMQLERQKAEMVRDRYAGMANRPFNVAQGGAMVSPTGEVLHERPVKPERGFEVNEPKQLKVGNQIVTGFFDPNIQRYRDANSGAVLEGAQLYVRPERPDRPLAPHAPMIVEIDGRQVFASWDPNVGKLRDLATGEPIEGAGPYTRSTVTPEDFARLEAWRGSERRKVMEALISSDEQQQALDEIERAYQQQREILQGGTAGPRKIPSPVPSRRQLNDPAGLFEDEDLP